MPNNIEVDWKHGTITIAKWVLMIPFRKIAPGSLVFPLSRKERPNEKTGRDPAIEKAFCRVHLPKPNPQSTIATNTAWEAAFLLFIAVCQVSILGICPSGPKQVHWKSKFVPFCCCKIGRNKILGIGRIWSFGVCQFSSPFLSGFCSETPGHSKKFQAWNICWVYDAWHVCIYNKI